MVSLMLFTIVALAMSTALFTINASWKRAQAMKTVMDNLNFAIEAFSRTVRTADNITCGDYQTHENCPLTAGSDNGSELVTLHSTLGTEKTIQYRRGFEISGQGLERERVYQLQKREYDGTSWSNWISMTTSEINITFLEFHVDGAEASDGIQPSVMMSIQGEARAAGQRIPFTIQTLVSQRNFE